MTEDGIPGDKLYHFVAGFLLSFFLGLFWRPLALTGYAAGFLKEIYDSIRGGDFDFKDLFATILGAMMGSLCLAYLLKGLGEI